MNFNPYLVLGVSMNADFEQLRATYRRLARENHPDVALDKPRATERMAQINRAWAILGDETKRAAFDAQWKHHVEQARQERARQEHSRREAARREIIRPRRAAPAKPPKKPPVAPNPFPKVVPRRAGSSGASAKRGKSPSPPASRPPSRPDSALWSPAPSPRALRLMSRITLASRLWHRDGNGRGAIEICRAVLLADGRNVPARELLSEIFAAQGRLEIAVMMLDQAIQIAPDDLFLQRKRDHLESARFPGGTLRPIPRPTLWQRLRARLSRTKRGKRRR